MTQVLECVHGPASGQLAVVGTDEFIVRVPATHVPGLVGVYRTAAAPPDGGPPRLRYDYAVEFLHDGMIVICHEVVAPGGEAGGADEARVTWEVRVGTRLGGGMEAQPDDFAPGSDFIDRTVRLADAQQLFAPPAAGTEP
jgi:hypothetical protein